MLLFGDTCGLPRLLRVLGGRGVQGLVRAEIRPEQEPELSELAAANDLPLLVQPRLDSPDYAEFAARVASMAPELIVVDSYSMLLRPDVLAIPELGALNVHFAPLPRYRGPNPTQWAIINGETETGVTLHWMTDAIDAGDIVAQRLTGIGFDETWVDVNRRLDAIAEELLTETLPRVLEGAAESTPQDESAATVSRRRTPEDGRIDWSMGDVEIYNLIRALVPPLPGAFYERDGERVVIDRRLTLEEVAELRAQVSRS